MTIPTTMYALDVNSGVPVEMNLLTFPYSVTVKIGINDVNEKSSSLAEDALFPNNTWRGLVSGQMTLTGYIDRTLFSISNIMTRVLLDAFVKSPTSKLVVNEVHGAKFYDISSVSYAVGFRDGREVRSNVTTTVSSTTPRASTTLAIADASSLVVGMVITVYDSGSSGTFELLEIKSISSNTLTFMTKTIVAHSAGATVFYDATQDCPVYIYTLNIRRCRAPTSY